MFKENLWNSLTKNQKKSLTKNVHVYSHAFDTNSTINQLPESMHDTLFTLFTMLITFVSNNEVLLQKSKSRPEVMRVINTSATYDVQTFSERLNEWITQKQHHNILDAIIDCLQWYPSY